MKIGLLESKINKEQGDLSKIIDASKLVKNGVVVAPEFFLSGLKAISEDYERNILERLASISSDFPECLLVPGTMLYHKSDDEIANRCPIFYQGKLFGDYFKETQAGESNFKNVGGRNYFRGNSSENKFQFGGKNFALQICRDQGKQMIPEDTDVELVLYHDQYPEFKLPANRVTNPRHVFLCDGKNPCVAAAKVKRDLNDLEILTGNKKGHTMVYQLK